VTEEVIMAKKRKSPISPWKNPIRYIKLKKAIKKIKKELNK
jgi:hypothetical protein